MGPPLASPFDSAFSLGLTAFSASVHPSPLQRPGPGVYETQGRHSVVGNFSGKGGALAVGTRADPGACSICRGLSCRGVT